MTKMKSKSLTVTLWRGPGSSPGAGVQNAVTIDEQGIMICDNLDQLARPYRRQQVAFSDLSGARVISNNATVHLLSCATAAVRPVTFDDLKTARTFLGLVQTGVEVHAPYTPDASQPPAVRKALQAEHDRERKEARERLLELLEEAREGFGDEVVVPALKKGCFEPAPGDVSLELAGPSDAPRVFEEEFLGRYASRGRRLVINLREGGFAEIGATESYLREPRTGGYRKSELWLYSPDGEKVRTATQAEVIALLREASEAYAVAS